MNYKLETISSFSINYKSLFDGVARLIKPIDDTYPKYDDWLYKKFFPGLKNGSRKIVVAYNDLNNPMGVVLLKDTVDEKKICCLFVREDCRGKGVAENLIKKSFAVLKTNKPLITVADRNLSQMRKLLDKYGFVFSYRKQGVYQKNDTENYFNNEATDVLRREILPALLASKNKKSI